MKKGLLKKILGAMMIGVMSFSLVACGGNSTETNANTESKNKLEEIKEKGELVVGLSADYAPYEFHAMIDGKDTIVGFDVDLANEIAKDLDVKLTIKEMEFNSLLGSLPADQIDMIISGMNPDPKRAEKVDFSELYYTAQHAVISQKDKADQIKKVEDLKDLKMGAQLGSTQADITEDVIKAKNPKLLADVNALILELKSGKIDALVTEKPVAEMAVKSSDNLKLTEIVFEDESGGNAVAVKKGEKELVEAVNKTIKRLKDSGELDKFIVNANELAAKEVKK